jgi:hypothetical protein
MRVVIMSCLLCIASIAYGQPQKPEPKTQNKNAAKDQRGTDKQPLVVRGITATKTKEQTEAEDKERAHSAAIQESVSASLSHLAVDSWRTALLTFGLLMAAIVQAAIFLWQLRLMKKAVKDSEVAPTQPKRAQAQTRLLHELWKTPQKNNCARMSSFRTHRLTMWQSGRFRTL